MRVPFGRSGLVASHSSRSLPNWLPQRPSLASRTDLRDRGLVIPITSPLVNVRQSEPYHLCTGAHGATSSLQSITKPSPLWPIPRSRPDSRRKGQYGVTPSRPDWNVIFTHLAWPLGRTFGRKFPADAFIFHELILNRPAGLAYGGCGRSRTMLMSYRHSQLDNVDPNLSSTERI